MLSAIYAPSGENNTIYSKNHDELNEDCNSLDLVVEC